LTQDQTPHQTDIDSVIHQDEVDTAQTNVALASHDPANGNGKSNGKTKVVANGAETRKSVRPDNAPGLKMERRFTKPGEDVYSTVEWELRDAIISNERGEKVFEQKDVEIPKTWTQLATNVVVSKYFRGHIGTPQRERSVRQLIRRVADTMANWGRAMDYFATEEDAQAFQDELTHILLHQKAAFNSPVWFNVGLVDQPKPQSSACFINSVSDTMDSILTLAKTEGMLFKYGSGTGTNLSPIRGSHERLEGGGTASGPVSFMRGFDQFAGAIKSGGKTRRAAKMVIMDIDHPDIAEFITCKEKEEKKAWALIDAGYNGSFNVPGGAYDSVNFQNANHSVRVTDAFMEATEIDGDWTTHFVLTKGPATTFKARDLMNMIGESAWVCGDPGMQYDTTINRWHTCKNTDRIYASNPCSEYMFLNDSACNLASLNLMKFRSPDGEFDVESFKHACRVLITAQEIIVDNASYPTPRIAENSHDYRPLGLGYANLGALLMAWGIAYDSDEGRALAGAITAIMTGEGYHQSSIIARDHGWAFPGYAKNREPFLEVMRMHRAAVDDIERKYVPDALLEGARQSWDDAIASGEQHGYRNAQATVLAPTGTIAFMMDADTTGIEPDIAIVKYKNLVGGGVMKIVNNTVPEALQRIGYTPRQVIEILDYIDQHDTIEGAPELKPEHLSIFDCAFKPANGIRSIHYMGHLRMMAAAQPFISGAISKTVNMPTEATPEEIVRTYVEGWKLGLKAIAIYRDGSKRTQPLMTRKSDEHIASDALAAAVADVQVPTQVQEVRRPMRRKLPDERASITHKFSIAGHEGYLTVGMYEDGTPGEIFLTMSKEGSTISGLMDSFATAISLALQYGVPLQTLVDKFAHSRFEPSGYTNNPAIRRATSIMDYIFRWLGTKFLNRQPEGAQPSLTNGHLEESAGPGPSNFNPAETISRPVLTLTSSTLPLTLAEQERETFQNQADAPICTECGSLMVRNGACFKCLNCGSVFGCS
jgi:ribonucleoside-diphosphate reductase alpha chain